MAEPSIQFGFKLLIRIIDKITENLFKMTAGCIILNNFAVTKHNRLLSKYNNKKQNKPTLIFGFCAQIATSPSPQLRI